MPSLHADQMRSDPRLAHARQLMHEVLHDHQAHLKEVRLPNREQRISYQLLIDAVYASRGYPLWLPYIGSGLGRGALVELADGSIKYDFIGGIGIHFGHSLPTLLDATLDAALDDVIMQGNLMQNRETIALMERLIKQAGMDHCFLTTSGAMAGENGLKIAFQAHQGRDRILAFSRGLMGRTCTLAQITDRPAFREGLPLNLGVDYLPFLDSETPAGSLQRTLYALEEHLERYPKAHAAMVIEMIQGEAGVRCGTRDFFAPIIKRLKSEGILIIADEVQTFGRTDHLFAYQGLQLEEEIDLVMVGKLAQVGATLWRKAINPKPGLLSQTYSSSSAAIRAALAVLDALEASHFGPMGRNAQLQKICHDRLADMPGVSGPFGRGTMVAFTPFDGDRERTMDLVMALFEAGVIGLICGQDPTRIRFLLPPGALSDEELHSALDLVAQVLQQSS